MNFLKLSYEANGSILPLFVPFNSLVNGGYFQSISGDDWASTMVILSSGANLRVVETADVILALINGTTTATVAENAPVTPVI